MNDRWFIWDLDNCLADDRPRIPLIRWAHYPTDACWAEYHAASAFDSVGNAHVFNAVHGPRTWARADRPRPLFITTRPERFRLQTEEWIFRSLGWALKDEESGAPMELVMRAEGDTRSSVDIKRDGLRDWLGKHPHATIVGAHDDLEAIIHMYRSHFAIPCRVLSIHDENTHANPLAPPRFDGRIDKTCDADLDALAKLRPEKDITRVNAGELLRAAADTYASRNAAYGSAYRTFGPALAALFPDGLTLAPGDPAWGRLALLVMTAGKLHRYARNLHNGGHKDSARDLAVYGAMLEEMTDGGE